MGSGLVIWLHWFFCLAMDKVRFGEARPAALSRNWTNKPLTGKSAIENWELRICYLLSEEAELAPARGQLERWNR